MITTTLHRTCALVVILASASSPAIADDVSKEVCIDSHSRGQDARDQNKLSLARKLFLTCAQPSCPTLVQGDCARLADDLGRMQPSLSFAARDATGVDLADTSVFIDEMLITTRLDDGKAHDVDPGKHSIKFVHAGKEQVLAVVVGAGERSRTISVTFGSPPSSSSAAAQQSPGHDAPKKPRTKHAGGSKLLLGAGAVLAVGGTAVGILGLTRVPANCSVGTHECAAPPGDPSFDEAGQAIQMTNIGFLAAGVGVAALVGGVVWYVKSGRVESRGEERLLAPWFTPSSAGIALTGRL